MLRPYPATLPHADTGTQRWRTGGSFDHEDEELMMQNPSDIGIASGWWHQDRTTQIIIKVTST